MKVAILAGGMGKRLAEETASKPKPLVEIGGRPILWHVMRHYARFGWSDFVVAAGPAASQLRDYLDATARAEGWLVDVVDTGLQTQTGGRLERLAPHLGGATFMLTWCDGLSDVDLRRLLEFHHRHGRLATVTAVRPPPRFGELTLDGDRVVRFSEKPPAREWINGAFFVLEPAAIGYVDDDQTSWERDSMVRLARDGQLMAFRHEGFWQCMDTVHDKQRLDDLWRTGRAPWGAGT